MAVRAVLVRIDGELLSELSDDARHYRRVAFRLQRSARASFRGVFARAA